MGLERISAVMQGTHEQLTRTDTMRLLTGAGGRHLTKRRRARAPEGLATGSSPTICAPPRS